MTPERRRGGAVRGHHPRHHQGVAEHRLVPVGGLLPGDHQGPHRRRPGRQDRPPERAQGERHHRQADSGSDRPEALQADRDRAVRAAAARDRRCRPARPGRDRRRARPRGRGLQRRLRAGVRRRSRLARENRRWRNRPRIRRGAGRARAPRGGAGRGRAVLDKSTLQRGPSHHGYTVLAGALSARAHCASLLASREVRPTCGSVWTSSVGAVRARAHASQAESSASSIHARACSPAYASIASSFQCAFEPAGGARSCARSAGTAAPMAARAGGGGVRRRAPPSRWPKPGRTEPTALAGVRRLWTKGSGVCRRSSGRSRRPVDRRAFRRRAGAPRTETRRRRYRPSKGVCSALRLRWLAL